MIWKSVADPRVVQNRYQIAEDGTLVDTLKGCVVKQHKDATGYMRFNMATPDSCEIKFPVHRVVAAAFLPAPEAGQTHVDHIDGNRANNHVSNLRWCTPIENNRNPVTVVKKQAAHRITETSLKRRVVCENTGEEFDSMTEAALHFNLTIAAVTQSCRKAAEGKARRPMKFGKPVMHFHLIIEEPIALKQDREETTERAASKPNSRPVKCLETGLEYPSASAAARAHGLRYSSVCSSCNRNKAGGKQAKAFGLRPCYHFAWISREKTETIGDSDAILS